MKTLLFVLFCLSVVLPLQSQEMFKIYGIKSGIIEYKHSGTSTGTSTVYFDDYGYKCANYMDMTEEGQTHKGWVISQGDMQYMYDPDTKTGQKLRNPMIEMILEMEDIEKITQETYAKMGFQEAGTEKFLGKDCRVFKGEMGKVLTWNGMLMFMEMSVMGTTTKQEATKIDVNVPVKSSLFEIPGDVEFTELPVFGID
ncbi:MAG: hypothetical protein JW973_07420 [Bacteroidales bacterium]|nr:hypothetical protein [Bacteroidales bacterium]